MTDGRFRAAASLSRDFLRQCFPLSSSCSLRLKMLLLMQCLGVLDTSGVTMRLP
jgi:hypothetical protein